MTKYKNWYRLTNKKLKKVYGIDYKLMAGLIASTSPRFSIKRNINTAKKVYNSFKNIPNFNQYFKNNKNEVLKEYKILNAHYHNILRCLNHNFNKKLVLSGLKVNSFYNNLTGNYNYVTIDIWMLKYFNHDKNYVSIKNYKKYSNIIKLMAYVQKIKPCELQALIWHKIRLDYGFKYKCFTFFI